ncbi:MAG: hypothetical protein GQ469_06185 [Methanosarcinales archaeon]|nr:hypothetical protein [Methanosarcinales archaeon]
MAESYKKQIRFAIYYEKNPDNIGVSGELLSARMAKEHQRIYFETFLL